MFRKPFLTVLILLLIPVAIIIYVMKVVNSEKVKFPVSQALPTFPKAKQLDVLDIEKKSGDEKILFATLQGNVNREEPRIYLIENKFEEGKYTWLKDLEVPYTVMKDPWDVLLKYKNEVAGMIIYDPEVQDTINVATTIAGVRNAVVASPSLAEKLQKEPYQLKVIEDLRTKFSNGLDAYRWQFENLWSETTDEMLIGLDPGKSIPLPNDNFSSFKNLIVAKEIRDGSNRDVYDLDLSEFLGKEAVYLRFQDAFPTDGWGAAIHKVTVKADGETISEFIPGTAEEDLYLYDSGGSSSDDRFNGHRWADNGNYFIYRFIPSENTKKLIVSIDMWNQYKVSASNIQPVSSDKKEPYGFLRDYAVANRAMVFSLESNVPEEKELFEEILNQVEPNTPYLGWFGNDVAGEFSGTELVSAHGVYVLPADWFNNMTVFSGVEGEIQKQAPLQAPELENKIYITFTLGEGDNLQYNQHHMRMLWDNERRGKVPINWSTTPILYDAAPSILAYYQKTATENDLLIAGPSGAGYIYPTPWPDETFHIFAKQTGEYMEKTGMDIIYALNRVNSRDLPLSEKKIQNYIDHVNLKGIFLGWDNYTETTILNGQLPQSILLSSSSVREAKEEIAKAARKWDGESPLFIAMGMLSWSITPADIEVIANSLGEEFVVVRGDQYFDLVRQEYGLQAK
ncbi:GxGYxYP domain-containing protein [Bacillus niameyensis]|uniref:GxGYxYP domain-containing protein n=1 Tax=Bacillus niameyensis TaxID=1522308 RepID=UPI0009FF26A8|nr:GxGYxYP domain-containing protein [Bacillus niameyensis]